MRRDAADHQKSGRNEQTLTKLGHYEEAGPEIVEEISHHGEMVPRSANDVPSDGTSLAGLLNGAIVLVVAWAVCLVTF